MNDAPTPFHFGFYYEEEREKVDRDVSLDYGGERHILLFGVNGAGKSTRILIENLVTLKNRSLVVFDMKGELAAQTHMTRRRLGDDVFIVNPYDVLQLGSDGYNPLLLLDPDSDVFFDIARLLTEAIIEEGGNNPFFPNSARGWFCAGIMWEVMQAKREGRSPSLLAAREWCLQPDEWGLLPDGKTEALIKGVTVNAKRAVKEGGRQVANLAGRFARDNLEKGDQDILATVAADTQFLISTPISRDLEKGTWSFAQLRQKPTTVYIVLPPDQVSDKRRWTRLLMTVALCEHLQPGPVHSVFILDEFRVSIGHLAIVNDFWALVRGYGVQFMPVCQSVLQLQALFKEEWENYAGQAECVATIGPPGDLATAEWMSKRTGMRTIWQEGWSTGESFNPFGGAGNQSAGETRGQVARAHRLPQELMNMKVGTGRLWTAGLGDRTTAFYAPNYWQRSEIDPLVDINPYSNAPVTQMKRACSYFDKMLFGAVRHGSVDRDLLARDRWDQWYFCFRADKGIAWDMAKMFAKAEFAGIPARLMAKPSRPKTKAGRLGDRMFSGILWIVIAGLWLIIAKLIHDEGLSHFLHRFF